LQPSLTWWEIIEKVEADSSQRHRAKGQAAGRGHKLQQRELRCKRGKTFTVGLVQHCSRFPREILESPSFEIFRTEQGHEQPSLILELSPL